ncbi:MAG: hypothetical protein OXO52_05070 [Rhodospirillales bacterium]|nr:hypothetical protein [Rhodospirillales bacterium]MDE0377905.1 hypothetical protein [Rhodospirillales bacterium]
MPESTSRTAFALVLAAALGVFVLTSAVSANAARTPTPEATQIVTFVDDDARLVIGFAAPLPGVPDKIGLAVVCGRDERSLYAALFFGFFPDGKPVQATVRDPAGQTMRLGPRVLGSRFSGFHDPEVHDRNDVLRLMKMAFADGALLGNGHNAVRNRIPDADNREARRRLLDCAGERR